MAFGIANCIQLSRALAWSHIILLPDCFRSETGFMYPVLSALKNVFKLHTVLLLMTMSGLLAGMQ